MSAYLTSRIRGRALLWRVQIFSTDETMSETLSAAVALVPRCQSVVHSHYPWATSVAQSESADIFAAIVYLDERAIRLGSDPFLDWLKALRTSSPERRIIAVLGQLGDQESVRFQRQLLEFGSVQIFERPLNIQQLRYQIESSRIEFDFRQKQSAPAAVPERSDLREVHRQMKKVARVEANVLLTGETGVGKTYWAEQIHRHSCRAEQPFVVVNCGNVSPTLVDSQLFGHKAGAFTGADDKSTGQFQYADRGTIFLDEVDSLPLEAQARLLRVVEERQFCPLGEVKPIAMNARVIAAANRDLEVLVRDGSFRKDLYYRLEGYQIHIPPLRERREEIPRLCEHFSAEFARKNNCQPVTFDDEAMEILKNYAWPGNLRELRNIVGNAAIDCEASAVHPCHLHRRLLQSVAQFGASEFPGETGEEREPAGLENPRCGEASRLVRALAKHNNNRSKAARELGVSRMTVYNLLRRYHRR